MRLGRIIVDTQSGCHLDAKTWRHCNQHVLATGPYSCEGLASKSGTMIGSCTKIATVAPSHRFWRPRAVEG
jgi:hypothetical protein